MLATHFLTVWRERSKRTFEEITRWRTDVRALLEEISEEARAHYTDPKEIENTQASAQRLLGKLKRFGAKMRDVTCVEPSQNKATSELIAELRSTITGPDAFQDTQRAVLPADSALIEAIMECEARLRTNIALPRKSKGT